MARQVQLCEFAVPDNYSKLTQLFGAALGEGPSRWCGPGGLVRRRPGGDAGRPGGDAGRDYAAAAAGAAGSLGAGRVGAGSLASRAEVTAIQASSAPRKMRSNRPA
jgi:hypothetical protein